MVLRKLGAVAAAALEQGPEGGPEGIRLRARQGGPGGARCRAAASLDQSTTYLDLAEFVRSSLAEDWGRFQSCPIANEAF